MVSHGEIRLIVIGFHHAVLGASMAFAEPGLPSHAGGAWVFGAGPAQAKEMLEDLGYDEEDIQERSIFE